MATLVSPPAAQIRRRAQDGPGHLPRLLCLPYAGGGSRVFRGWGFRLRNVAQVMPAELAGRDGLLDQPPARRLQPYVEALVAALLADNHDPRKLVLFGHSMGALLAFEIARSLRRRQVPGPGALCVSAHRAPQLTDPRRPIHALPEAEFIAELRALRGMPEEVLRDRQMMDFFMPLLRADFCCCETYRYVDEPPLACRILALGGVDDAEVPSEHVSAWRAQTCDGFEMKLLAGGHFFIQEGRDELLAVLERELIGAGQRT